MVKEYDIARIRERGISLTERADSRTVVFANGQRIVGVFPNHGGEAALDLTAILRSSHIRLQDFMPEGTQLYLLSHEDHGYCIKRRAPLSFDDADRNQARDFPRDP